MSTLVSVDIIYYDDYIVLSLYSLIISLIASLVVVSLVLARNFRDTKTRVYVLLTFFFTVMSIANYFAIESLYNQLLSVRIVMLSSVFAIYFIYLLAVYIRSNPRAVLPYKSSLFYLTGAVGLVSVSSLLFPDVIAGSPPTPVPGPGIVIYFGYFIYTISLAIRVLYKNMQDGTDKEKRQYKLLIFGAAPALLLAPLTSFILPNLLGISQFVALTPLYAFIFVSCVGYAIVRHGLFDVRLAAVRTLAYVLALSTLSAAYYLLAYIVSVALFQEDTMSSSVSVSPINILLALLLAFIFQPIRNFFDKITDSVFYRDRYSTEDFFAQLNQVLTSTTDLRSLLHRSAGNIAKTLKTQQAFFFVYHLDNHYVSSGTKGHSRLPMRDAHALDEYVNSTSEEVIITELMEDMGDIKRLLQSHNIALLLPLSKEGRIIGYLALGDQMGGGFTARDVRTLTTASDELFIAIQNALSIQEVKELNATLQQRIDVATKELRDTNAKLRHLDATKDEFISMASHQLRTPLTSVKGYLSMVLEGDVGKVGESQKQLLQEAFMSSERMVHLIGDFLNVSRLQTGKFIIDKRQVELDKLVKQEVDSLKGTAGSHELSIECSIAGNVPKIDLDESKMRQVVMNLIDNAIYYSPASTKIKVKLEYANDAVSFTVKDHGIGVPKQAQAGLFGKFYRAENARQQRPDGTGVGLFLAKKVIDAHGGKVIFESVENKGSTFGFSLPVSTP